MAFGLFLNKKDTLGESEEEREGGNDIEVIEFAGLGPCGGYYVVLIVLAILYHLLFLLLLLLLLLLSF